MGIFGRGFGRQPFEQGIEAGAGRGEPRLQAVAFTRERIDLFLQQRVGALHLFVTHEQAFHTLGDLVDGAGGGHGWRL
ncbi:hypothetical protein D3C72_1799060 [compost metagenome]